MKETEKKKILIIEDEKPLSHALVLKLSHEGFDVDTTTSSTLLRLASKLRASLIVNLP
jgi:DNA-binding response OmpR family regulator